MKNVQVTDGAMDALVEARGDHDPRNAVIIALAEVGFIVPDTCREDSLSLKEAE